MNEGKRRPGFMLYKSTARTLANLPVAEAGTLIKAICTHELEGKPQELDDPVLDAVFQGVKAELEEDDRRYQERCEQNARNARMRTQATASDG